MKKVLCLLISVSFTILLSAKSIITLKTGDVSIFSKSAKAVVEFDYDSAEIEDSLISFFMENEKRNINHPFAIFVRSSELGVIVYASCIKNINNIE